MQSFSPLGRIRFAQLRRPIGIGSRETPLPKIRAAWHRPCQEPFPQRLSCRKPAGRLPLECSIRPAQRRLPDASCRRTLDFMRDVDHDFCEPSDLTSSATLADWATGGAHFAAAGLRSTFDRYSGEWFEGQDPSIMQLLEEAAVGWAEGPSKSESVAFQMVKRNSYYPPPQRAGYLIGKIGSRNSRQTASLVNPPRRRCGFGVDRRHCAADRFHRHFSRGWGSRSPPNR